MDDSSTVPKLIQIRTQRSLAIHKEIAKRLKEDSTLWDVPQENLERWGATRGASMGFETWRFILGHAPHDEILELMVSESVLASELRKCSPFVGIIDEETRKEIFERYR